MFRRYTLPNGDVLKPRLKEKAMARPLDTWGRPYDMSQAWLAEAVLWTMWWHRGEFKAGNMPWLQV